MLMSMRNSSIANYNNLESVFFINVTHGWVGGDGGLWQSSDRGLSWDNINIPDLSITKVRDIEFIDDTGWILVEGIYTPSVILRADPDQRDVSPESFLL